MIAASLPELLSTGGLSDKKWIAGRTVKTTCPQCGGGRTREQSLSLTVESDRQSAAAKCHRGSCGWEWGGKVTERAETTRAAQKSPANPPKTHKLPPPIEASKTAQTRVYDWFAARKIEEETVDCFSCFIARHYVPGLKTETDCVVFPYFFEKKVVNRKYRAISEKSFAQEKDALPTLYNFDLVETPDVLIFAEGEVDVMTLFQCGYPQSVSIKDGAPKEARAADDPRAENDLRFEALNTHADFLSQVKKFVLAGDMDKPGLALREELARRLGRHRCWMVTWPDGCKDANETLLKKGQKAVMDAVEAAEPYPIEGIEIIDGKALAAYLALPPPPCFTTGIPALDDKLRIPGEGKIIVILGIPNSGKTTLMMNMMVHLMKNYHRRFLVFSPEMGSGKAFMGYVASVLVGKPIWKQRDRPFGYPMTPEDHVKAGDWLKHRMIMLNSDSEDDPPNLDTILEKGRQVILRYGVTDVVIDPVNELDQARGSLSETDYVGRMMQKIRSFCHRHGCNVWLVHHPTKMRPAKPGEPIPPPGAYDAAGSSHYANKADLGITVHTPAELTEVHIWKSRFNRWGRKNEKAIISYNQDTCRYEAPEGTLQAVMPYWQDQAAD